MLVYKYQKIDEWFYKNLINMEIFCNSPENFNDPFDCQIQPNYFDDLKKIIEELRDYIGLIDKYIKEGIKSIGEITWEELSDKRFVEDTINKLLRDTKNLNISSFSKADTEKKTYENELLWAHYANSHKGICIEYEIESVEKVNYSYEYPKLSEEFIKNMLFIKREGIESSYKYEKNLIQELKEKILLTKSKAWEYEEEWRLIQIEPIKKIEKSQIKSIYFGLKTSKEDIKKVIKLLDDLEIKIPIYQMEKVNGKFLFEPKLIKK